jgi:rhodanese-related sulfurtransferase
MFGQSPVPTVSVDALAAVLAADPSTPVIDVREPHEFANGHVENAVLMPMAVVPVRVAELPRDRTVYVICQVGGRSAQAVAWLNEQGFDTVNVEGGTQAWMLSGRPVA